MWIPINTVYPYDDWQDCSILHNKNLIILLEILRSVILNGILEDFVKPIYNLRGFWNISEYKNHCIA